MLKNQFPGFTAEATLYSTSACYQSSATRGYSCGEQRVVSQLRVGGGISTGGLSFHWPSWCELGCAAAAATCIAGTSGVGIAACVAAEILCLQGCNSKVAFA
jgi:hypothetical protein